MGTSLGTLTISNSVTSPPTAVPGVTLFRNDFNTLPLRSPVASLEGSLEAIRDHAGMGPEGWWNHATRLPRQPFRESIGIPFRGTVPIAHEGFA